MTRTQLVNWIWGEPQPKQVKPNLMVDYYAIRLQRLTRLREIAKDYASQSNDLSKLAQANRLISELTQRIQSRYVWKA